jgi:hypothetical protein
MQARDSATLIVIRKGSKPSALEENINATHQISFSVILIPKE